MVVMLSSIFLSNVLKTPFVLLARAQLRPSGITGKDHLPSMRMR